MPAVDPMKDLLRKYVPWRWKRAGRLVVYSVLDAVDRFNPNRNPMVPPRTAKLAVGSGDYIGVGRHLRDCMVQEGLRPEHRVLEIGSGYGRVALALTEYLTTGSYDGVEIIQDGVDWANEQIGSRCPNFRFHHADVSNGYVDRGSGAAVRYTFPFGADSFDFIYLTSVFTHMRPAEIAHYLKEMARMLAPKGRTFATFYLVDDFTLPRLAAETGQRFPYALDDFFTSSLETPESAIAVRTKDVMRWYADAGLSVECIRYGSWSGRPNPLTWQDAVVASGDPSGPPRRSAD